MKPQLKAEQSRAVNEPGRYRVAEGLYLAVSPGGTKSWVLRMMVRGKRKDYGLGTYPRVGLSQARKLDEARRIEIAEGKNPHRRKEVRQIPTFAEAARATYEANLPRWREHRQNSEWIRSLERHVFPKLGKIPINEITQQDVISVLQPIWGMKKETVRRVRQRIRATFAWALAQQFVDRNPAGEAIDAALPPMPKAQEHMRSVPYQDVAQALKVVEDSRASEAVEFCL